MKSQFKFSNCVSDFHLIDGSGSHRSPSPSRCWIWNSVGKHTNGENSGLKPNF